MYRTSGQMVAGYYSLYIAPLFRKINRKQGFVRLLVFIALFSNFTAISCLQDPNG